ncbi:acyl-CoA dehydrogenase family protein [Sphingosinicella microcystinivorans]|uniref:Acyl-CoA dehydrogenase n=1 Tax=Sphingosinicella microcystinivorans TaxID=335406 RepID=A0AAD1G059_SPHMI|nr:acyl-CoA dehydrogenase family protein [Sphingosinicella microcystinivorans]BBE33295.1 acyl-CoA dehydrogenase [Sphingosinicella microcystinivorans]
MTEDINDFRRNVREWLADNCPEEMRTPMKGEFDAPWGGRVAQFDSDAQKMWFDRMVERRWLAPDWPEEYGGAGLSAAAVQVLAEELRRIRARPPILSEGLWMIGPAILRFGSDAQKREHLPRIARGQIRWCQGFSEPGAGSDLASLKTRAEDRGDHWLVNGQKVWTSYAHDSDWMFCLVRSEPEASKREGISILLIDMETPGIEARPIRLISGHADFCETFFDDVRVPRDNLLGERGRGWNIAKYILSHEREMIGGSEFEGVTPAPGDLGATLPRGEAPDGMLRAALADYDIDLIAYEAFKKRMADEVTSGTSPLPAMPSVLKNLGADLEMRRKELAMSIGGSEALRFDEEGGAAARTWLRSRSSAIAGGTTEVQWNIIARAALGLK